MRRPKDQVRAKAKPNMGDMLTTAVEVAKEIETPKAENVILPSERKPAVAVKKSRAVRPSPKGSAQSATGSKASEKPQEAATAKEAPTATPVAKKPKAQPKAKPEAPEKAPAWQPPVGGVTIFEKPEYTKPIGYTLLMGRVYEAYTTTGQRLAIGLSREKTEDNFRDKYAANRSRK